MTNVKLEDVIFAIETTDQDSESYLDEETGEIETLSYMTMTPAEIKEVSERLDEYGFVRLPVSEEINEYGIMENFVYSRKNDSERRKLAAAIQEHLAFRRFRNMIRDLNIEQDWYAFQENAYRDQAVQWCKDHNVQYQ